jgi:hypothetical protein
VKGVLGFKAGFSNIDISQMIAVESNDDERRYRLFRDQLSAFNVSECYLEIRKCASAALDPPQTAHGPDMSF